MPKQEDQSRKALQDLEKLKDEGDLLHAPKMKAKSKTVTGHFMAKDVVAEMVNFWRTSGRQILAVATRILSIELPTDR